MGAKADGANGQEPWCFSERAGWKEGLRCLVTRLFCLLADDLNPPWWRRIDKGALDLGSGCRVIDKGGTFNAKYNLVVKPWRET